MYKQTRKQSGLCIEEASFQLHIAPRTLCKYEAAETHPGPEVALAMGRVYKAPALTMQYCRRECAIGTAYSYEVLNNVDLSPQNILLKLHQVHQDAGEAIGRLLSTVINKQQHSDFTDGEQQSLEQDLHDLLDLEHTIETLKMELGERQWCDIPQLVSEHNSKCFDRGYVVHGVVREVEQIYAYGLPADLLQDLNEQQRMSDHGNNTALYLPQLRAHCG